jgi:hypothetical protein
MRFGDVLWPLLPVPPLCQGCARAPQVTQAAFRKVTYSQQRTCTCIPQVAGGDASPSPSPLSGPLGGAPFSTSGDEGDDLVSRQLALLARQVRRLDGKRRGDGEVPSDGSAANKSDGGAALPSVDRGSGGGDDGMSSKTSNWSGQHTHTHTHTQTHTHTHKHTHTHPCVLHFQQPLALLSCWLVCTCCLAISQ